MGRNGLAGAVLPVVKRKRPAMRAVLERTTGSCLVLVAAVFAASCRVDVNQFDIEQQHGIRRNAAASAVLAVSEVRRNDQLVLGAFAHQLQRFGPTRNHLTDAKRGETTELTPIFSATET